jgi:Kef-type K+ transport system membrane component KefB
MLMHILLAVVVVIAASRALGALLRALRQPAVVGEILAGIMLGPSLFGAVAPVTQGFIFPASLAPHLGVVAQIGIILFMFLVGLEMDTAALRKRSGATLGIALGGIVVPFILGFSQGRLLYPLLAPRSVLVTHFALFVGICMSVTAFPVLARILIDRDMQRSPLGVLALGCAAVADALAWCLLAIVVGVTRSETSGSLRTILFTVGYLGAMLFVVRPVIRKLVQRIEFVGKLSEGTTAAVLMGLLLSALATEAIGLHALFGAFLLGAIIPHDSLAARELTRGLEGVVAVLFVPIFFSLTGLRTQIGLLQGFGDLAVCGSIVLVACLGKFGGTAMAARAVGLSWHESSALGILMNTRGLMELIVLNVGLDLGVLSPKAFTMLVIMAVVTTVAAVPLLQLILPNVTKPREVNALSRLDPDSVS